MKVSMFLKYPPKSWLVIIFMGPLKADPCWTLTFKWTLKKYVS